MQRHEKYSARVSLAVIVPVRNGGDLLDDCLRSVGLEVTEYGAELIVVDDGSSDGTPDRARAKGATVICHEQPRGPAVRVKPTPQRTRDDLLAHHLT